jgi:hypothetical protein
MVVSHEEVCYDLTRLQTIDVCCTDRGPGTQVLSNFVSAKPFAYVVSALLRSPMGSKLIRVGPHDRAEFGWITVRMRGCRVLSFKLEGCQ